MRGRIKKLFPDKGYGWIRTDERRDVFMHRNDSDPVTYDLLAEGDFVEFDEIDTARGPRAEGLRRI